MTLQLRAPPLDFAAREVLVAIIDGFEFTPPIATLAVASNPILRHTSTKRAQTFLMPGPLSLRESADRFVIGRKPDEQPHHFDVAASFALEPTARMHTVEISVNV